VFTYAPERRPGGVLLQALKDVGVNRFAGIEVKDPDGYMLFFGRPRP